MWSKEGGGGNVSLLVDHQYLGFVWKKEAERLCHFLVGPPLLLHLPTLLDELAGKSAGAAMV